MNATQGLLSSFQALTVGDALAWGPLAVGIVFAALMSWRKRGQPKDLFITLMLEAMVFVMGVIVVISLISPTVFRIVTNDPAYYLTLAMIVVIYAGRDIYRTLHR